ncbi:MAG: carboxypeptidase-like regulatory domain-containing protein [Planctomycetota bacterium]
MMRTSFPLRFWTTCVPMLAAMPPALGQGSVISGATRAPAPRAPLDASGTGTVLRRSTGTPVAQARLTLFTQDLSLFRETRSLSDGSYLLRKLPVGTFTLGASAPGFGYEETTITLYAGANVASFSLQPETHLAVWQVIGDTSWEFFDGTDIGILRVDP